MFIISINYMSDSIRKKSEQNKQIDVTTKFDIQFKDDERSKEEQVQLGNQQVGKSNQRDQEEQFQQLKNQNNRQNQNEKKVQIPKNEQYPQIKSIKSKQLQEQQCTLKSSKNSKHEQTVKAQQNSNEEKVTQSMEKKQETLHYGDCAKQNKSCCMKQSHLLKDKEQKLIQCQKKINDLQLKLESQKNIIQKRDIQISSSQQKLSNKQAQLKQALSLDQINILKDQVASHQYNSQIWRKKFMKIENDLEQKIKQNEMLKKQIQSYNQILSQVNMENRKKIDDWMKKSSEDKIHEQQLAKLNNRLAQLNNKKSSLQSQLQNVKRILNEKNEEHRKLQLEAKQKIKQLCSLLQKNEKEHQIQIQFFSQFQQKKKQYEQQITYLQSNIQIFAQDQKYNEDKIQYNTMLNEQIKRKSIEGQKYILQLKEVVQKQKLQNKNSSDQFIAHMTKKTSEVVAFKKDMESRLKQFEQKITQIHQQSKRQYENNIAKLRTQYLQKIESFEKISSVQKSSYESKLILIQNSYQLKIEELKKKVDQYKQHEAKTSDDNMNLQQQIDKNNIEINTLKKEVNNLKDLNNKYSSFIEIFKQDSPMDQQFLQKLDNCNKDSIFDHVSIKISYLIEQLKAEAIRYNQLARLQSDRVKQLEEVNKQRLEYKLKIKQLGKQHEQKLNQLELKIKRQSQSLEELNACNRTVIQKRQQLEDKLRTAQKLLAQRQKMIESMQANEQNYLKEQVKINKQISQMKLSLDKYQRQIIPSKQEQPNIRSSKQPQIDTSAYQQQISILTQQVSKTNTEKYKLSSKLDGLEAENRSLKSYLSGLESQVKLLKRDKQQLQDKIVDLQANPHLQSFAISQSYEELYMAIKEQKEIIEKDFQQLQKKYKTLMAQKGNSTALKRKASFSSLSLNSYFTMKSSILREENSKDYIVKYISSFTKKQVKYVDLIFKMDEINKNNFGYIFNELDLHSHSIIVIIRSKNHVVAFLTLPKNLVAPCVVLISVTHEKTFIARENLSSDTTPYKYDYISLYLGGQQVRIKSGTKQFVFATAGFRKYFQNYSKAQIFGEEFSDTFECDQFQIHKVTLD